nr:hypothetical protein JVH1_8857 [Rhodococcus sp. JVH1]
MRKMTFGNGKGRSTIVYTTASPSPAYGNTTVGFHGSASLL